MTVIGITTALRLTFRSTQRRGTHAWYFPGYKRFDFQVHSKERNSCLVLSRVQEFLDAKGEHTTVVLIINIFNDNNSNFK